MQAAPAVVVGTSAGAAIAVDFAVRRPGLVRAAVAHEFPWRFTRHLPTASQVVAPAGIASLALRGRHGDAAEVLLRTAYTYPGRGSVWDFRNSIGTHPSAAELATITVPVVCSYGTRSPHSLVRLVRSLASAIPTAQPSTAALATQLHSMRQPASCS